MRTISFLLAGGLLVLLSLPVFADDNPEQFTGPAINQPCMECGVIFEIRPIMSEREIAKTFEERAPEAGPVINIPLTGKPDAKPQVGVIGNKQMRERLQETVYEVVVRFDDDRFTLIEVNDVSELSVGDRVRVFHNRVERIDSH